jgi:23S rRNA pseudouridine1911/1915/1917 synthase
MGGRFYSTAHDANGAYPLPYPLYYTILLWVNLLEKRKITKEYLALCEGVFEKKNGIIDLNIRRPKKESIMREAVEKGENKGECTPEGATAVTEYKVIRENGKASLVEFSIITGRTHQIRVHSNATGHSIIGDSLYGKPSEIISRQALHAHRLSFIHPFTDKKTEIISPLPEDIRRAERILFEE